MKNVLKIFFSWQTSSKTDKLNNKQFIWSCIEKAASEVKGKGELKNVSFEILEGTGGEPGTPDMIATCLKRNDECHIFIADISVDKKFSRIQKWVNQKPDLRHFVKVYYAFGFSTLHNPYPELIFKKENMQEIMAWCGQHPDVGPYRLMALAPLLNGDGLSEAVMLLMDNYGSDKLVRAALSDKLGSFSGPASTYDARAKLIEPLTKHKNPDVSSWASLEISSLKYYGEQSQRWEDNLMLPGRLPGHQWTLNDDEDEA